MINQAFKKYLDEFSKSLATEVRMLLNEVSKLREERRNIQLLAVIIAFLVSRLLTNSPVKLAPCCAYEANTKLVACLIQIGE
jgi:hypothetical protein